MRSALLNGSYGLSGSNLPGGAGLIWAQLAQGMVALGCIAATLAWIAWGRRRGELDQGWVFGCLAAATALFGITELAGILMPSDAARAYAPLLQLTAAGASVGAGLLLWRLVGRSAVLPSAGQLQAAGDRLGSALGERDAARAALDTEVRRREHAEAALLDARKLEAIGHLTGGVAHDFNNLLQAVAGNLELIARKPDDADRVVRWSASALDAVGRGRALTSQLLAFSRKQRLEVTSIRLADLIAGMKDLLDRAVAPLGHVRVERIDPSWNVEADPLQLELVILNLAFNARDAMPDGGLLKIAAERRRGDVAPDLPPGDYIALTLSDTGTPARPKVPDQAAGRFLTTGEMEDAPMGLPMTLGVLAQLGGAVAIDSEEGRGTVVTLFLRAATQEPVRVAPDDDAADERFNLLGCRIALIDDDASVRGALVETLQGAGAEVFEAHSGAEGVQMVETASPDLLVVDYAMPGMSGGDVVRRVHAHLPDLPVVLVTGFADSPSLDGVAGDRVCILRKPFEAQELLRAIAELLGRRQVRSSRI